MMKFLSLAIAVLLSWCAVGPNYKRPTVSVPRAIAALCPTNLRSQRVAGQREVVGVYQDPVLADLITPRFSRIMTFA